jgi:hypothetical protein
VFDAFCRPRGGWGRCLQERFERHPDDVRRPATEAPGRAPERTTERSRQADRNLVIHKRPPIVHCNCSATPCGDATASVLNTSTTSSCAEMCAREAHIGVSRSVPETVPGRDQIRTSRQPTPTNFPTKNGPKSQRFRPVL